jgi:hypothetical protein
MTGDEAIYSSVRGGNITRDRISQAAAGGIDDAQYLFLDQEIPKMEGAPNLI